MFFFGQRKPFFETLFCFRFFYRIILFWIISLLFYLFYFLHFIHFSIFYSFWQIQISETWSPFAVSELLDLALESVSLAKDNWLLYFVDGNVDLPVLPFNIKDIKHTVFPLCCCYRQHAFAGQVSDVANCKAKVSPGNELIGHCYELYNL